MVWRLFLILENWSFGEECPPILSKVYYGTADERVNWIEERIAQFARIIENNSIEDDEIEASSHYFLERIKLLSLFAKHHGFLEEHDDFR